VYDGCGSVNRKIVLAGAIVIAVVIVVSLLLIANPFWSTKQWKFLETRSGEGSYNSPVFTLNNTWRIRWAYANSTVNLFVLVVHAEQGTEFPPILFASSEDTNETSGILNVDSTGNFYYSVLASVSWNLTVEEYR
jgi:hypothetical protein